MGDIRTFLQNLTAGVGTASNTPAGTHAASVIEDSQQRQRDAQTQNLTMLQDAAKKQQLIAAHFTDPTTGKAYPQYQPQYDDAMTKFGGLAGQIYESQHPNPESMSFEHRMGIRALSKMHLTNDLNSRIDKWKKHEEQFKNNLAADGQLPYAWTPEGDAAAAKTRDSQTLEAQRAKAASELEGQRAASAENVEKLKLSGASEKGPKIDEKGGAIFITDPKTGTMYSDSNKGDAPPEIQRLFQDAITGQKAKEKAEKNKEYRRLSVQERLAQFRADLSEKSKQLAESSKIPIAIAGRMTQAQIIKEQTADLRAKLQDKELQRVMGPISGRTLGAAANLYSKKVHDFYASQESLDALLPLLHGYRGGAQTHEVFKKSMGSLTIDPNAYLGTLDALDTMADNVVAEVKQEYPNAPQFQSGGGPSGPTHQKNLKTKQQGGGGSSKMKVKLSDGRVGTIDAGDFDPSTMTKVQ